jgi:hypothetical protein
LLARDDHSRQPLPRERIELTPALAWALAQLTSYDALTLFADVTVVQDGAVHWLKDDVFPLR